MKVVSIPGAKSSVGWLKPEETLTVLAISNVGAEGTKYLIWSDEQDSIALFPASDFKIVDSTLSRRWVAGIDANGFIYLAPSAWQMNGFWESYYDGVPSAERTFKDEMAALVNE